MRVVITAFGGEAPRLTEFALPEQLAVRATNVKLTSGEVRGIHALTTLHDFGNAAIKSAFRIPYTPDDLWLGFESVDAFFTKGPLVSDAYDRFYWHEPGGPLYYNSLARIAAGNTGADAPYLLGVPAPANAPDVTPTGGSGLLEDRAYVYTWVTSFGEEGPPSAPMSATGYPDATWTIDNFDVAVPDAAERDVTHINIYRTVQSITNTAEFYFVAQIPIATLTYDDLITNLVVASLGVALQSVFWQPPIADMDGVVTFPGGVFIGWKGNTIHMSVPHRPHAWSPLYDLALEHDIVGIGVVGTTVVVATEGHPVIITMTTPDNASVQKIEAPEPCLERGSLVAAVDGVFYATQNGLMGVSPGGFVNATKEIISKEDWLRDFAPETIHAARYQTSYLAITNPGSGFVVDGTDTRTGLIELDGLSGVSNAQNDVWSGDVYLIAAGIVLLWDDPDNEDVVWRWASKRFWTPYEVNIGAVRIGGRPSDLATLPAPPVDAVYGVRADPVVPGDGPTRGMPDAPPEWAAWTLRVYVEGALVYTRHIVDGNTVRLPSGYKSQDWSFEIIGRRPMVKFEFAETAKELRAV